MNKNHFLKNFLAVSIILVVLVLSFYRLFYGAEMSDEFFSISESYLIGRGGVPIVNNWSQSPTFALLLTPFINFYIYIVGSTKGIFLFFRIQSFIYKTLIASLIFILIKKEIPRDKLILSSLVIFPSNYLGIFIAGYVILSVNLFMVVAFLILSILLTTNKNRSKIFSLLAGGISSLMSVSYPPFVFLIPIFLFILHLKRKEIGYYPEIYYLLGASIVGATVFGIICMMGGGLENLINGINVILKENPYFKLSKTSTVITTLKHLIALILRMLPTAAISSTICTIAINFIARIKPPKFFSNRQKLLLVTISSIVLFIYIRIFVNLHTQTNYSMIYLSLLPVPVILSFFIKQKRDFVTKSLLTIWIPNLTAIAVVSLFVRDGFLTRGIYALPSLILTMIYLFLAINENFKTSYSNRLFLLVSTLVTTAFVIIMFRSVYRDENINKLKYRVSEGVYSGIFTTEKRGNGLEELENVLRKITIPQDSVLFMETVPMAYLMTDSKPLTPSTWDITLYSYNFNNDALYQKYFNIAQEIPSKVIYVDTQRKKPPSIFDNEYKFNDFINRNYNLSYINENITYPVRVYTRK